MSIFYNVRIEGGEGTTNKDPYRAKGLKLAEFEAERTTPILENQEDYEVGVVRFKIPSSTIPNFVLDMSARVYKVGFNFMEQQANSFVRGNINNPIPTNTDDGYYGGMVNLNGESFLTNYFVQPQGANQNFNPYSTTSLPSITCNNNNMEINNEEEWSSIMSAGMLSAWCEQHRHYAYNHQGINSAGTQNGGTPLQTGNYNNANVYTPIFLDSWGSNGNQNLRTITIPPEAYNQSLATYGIMLEDIVVSNNATLKNLSVSLQHIRQGATEPAFTQVLMDGFSHQGATDFQNRLILSPMYPMDLQKCIYRSKFNMYKVSGETQTYLARPTLSSQARWDGGATLPAEGAWRVVLTNNGLGSITIGKFHFNVLAVPATDHNIPAPNPNFTSTQASPFASVKNPIMKFDGDTGKFQVEVSNGFFSTRPFPTATIPNPPDTNNQTGVWRGGNQTRTSGNEIYFNYNLRNLFDFDYINVEENWTRNIGYDNGIDLESAMLYYQTDSITGTAPDNPATSIYIGELNASNFKRVIMNSIIISTTSLAVQGEIIGGDNNVARKILTDFEPDIDQLATDYQYYSQGYVRYYPLKANLPLRKVGLKLYWEDIYGDLNPFYIQNGDVITMKLEFRPKNMIQYYPQ